VSEHGPVVEVAAGWTEEEGEGASHAAMTRLASVTAMGGFLFGYDSAVINGTVGHPNRISADCGRTGLERPARRRSGPWVRLPGRLVILDLGRSGSRRDQHAGAAWRPPEQGLKQPVPPGAQHGEGGHPWRPEDW
jgi:hypothetical protein